MNGKLLSQLPDFLCENELVERLKILPNYNINIANETMPTRLLALSELYDIYIPYSVICHLFLPSDQNQSSSTSSAS